MKARQGAKTGARNTPARADFELEARQPAHGTTSLPHDHLPRCRVVGCGAAPQVGFSLTPIADEVQ
jgi:hypothetical protein